MFEQVTRPKKLKRRLGRAISIVLSAAMIVTALPADLLGGIASVSAAPDAGKATVLNVSDMTKGTVSKGALNGSVFNAEDDSMSVVEDKQSFDGEDYTQSLKLTKTSAITFDAARGDTLTVYVMADESQESTDKAATKLTVTGEGTGTGATKPRDTKEMPLTEALASKEMALAIDGSYTLTVDGTAKVFYLALESAGTGSTVEKVTKQYVWDTTQEPTAGDIVNGARLGTEKYFKAVAGTVTITDKDGKETTIDGSLTKKTGNAGVTGVEISKCGSASVDFTVKGTASVTIEAGSTSGSNQSVIALQLKGADGYVKPTKTTLAKTSGNTEGFEKEDGSVVVSNTKGNTIVYEELPAGTYSIISPNDSAYSRGTRVIKVTVVDDALWGDDTLLDWSQVAAPVIESAKVSTTDKGTIEVQASGAVGNGAADSLKVVMFDKDGKEVDSKEDLAEEDVHTLNFQPTATGSYTFVAHLVREDETDKESAPSEAVAFVLPLAKPAFQGVANVGRDAEGKGGLAITWDPVPEAEKYEVTITDANDATRKLASGETAETTITLGGLEVGLEVTVSVVAKRGTDVSEPGTINEVVKASGGVVYEIDLSNGLKAGETYADGMLSVMIDMPAKTSDDKKTYVKGNGNPKKGGSGAAGAVPDEGTVVVVKTPETYEGNKVVRFTVSSKASGKTFYLVSKDARGRENIVAEYQGGSDPVGKKFVLEANKEYYFYANGSNQEIYQLKIEYQEIVRGPWDDVENPVIGKTPVIAGDNNGKIIAQATGVVNDTGADSMTMYMYDARGDLIASKTVTDESNGDEPLSFEFEPTTSGKFSFQAALEREGELPKYSEKSDEIDFQYPLATPEFAAVTNKGVDAKGAKLEVIWLKVSEARKYKVAVYPAETTDANAGDAASEVKKQPLAEGETSAREYTFEGLPAGEKVIVSVVAVRAGDDDVSQPGTKEVTLTGEFERTWIGASYGSNAKKSETATVNDDGTISINASSNTKIVPGSTDGVMYYYTKLDASENFTLTAKLKSVSYKPDNGQEGFGIMAADAVGEHGDGAAFWNNSYQIVASQIQYNWDPTVKDASGRYVGAVTSLVSDSETVFQNKMRLGIGWTLKQGVTYEEKQKIAKGELQQPTGWSSGTQGTLETSVSSAIMEALYKENIITNDSTPEEVQAAYKDYARVYRTKIDVDANGNVIGASKDSNGTTPYGEFSVIGGETTYKTNTVQQIGDKEFTPVTEMIYQIQRNNTGYNLRYMNPEALELTEAEKAEYETACTEDGKVKGTKAVVIGDKTVVKVNWSDGTSSYHEVIGSKVLYDDSRNTLSQIDMKNLYVGFFAARVTKVDVLKYGLETISSEDDFAAEEKVKEIVPLQVRVLSAESSNSEKYELIFTANADGKLYVVNKTEDGKSTAVVSDYAITAGKRAVIGTKLKAGANNFEYVFKASKDYVPGEDQVLDRFEDSGSHKVTFASLGSKDEIWVAPEGTSDGTDKEHPTDIYSAVAYAQPGQTIQLIGGEYKLGKDVNGKGGNQNLLIARGIDGTKDKMIVMQSEDPANRAVLNFQGVDQSSAGLTLVANYWHLKNFDVTYSKNGQDGVLISGKNNIIEGLHTYKNGNTGIQLARYGSDGRDLWPANNLVLNCTSYLNADEGYQDADGFAAKLTVGDGNRFSGCVAAYNADDGWDLFSKVQTGNIGAVTIENCVAYRNGRLIGPVNAKGEPLQPGVAGIDETAGTEFEAGNGNGFKMGGDGLSGHHVLKNSVAFENMANGIDSNSCPDIEVYNCISFNNKTNIALTNYDSSVNSAYIVRNLLSVDGFNKDSIHMLGRQITGNIYNTTNYFWDGDNAYRYDGSPSKRVEGALPAAKVIFESTDPVDAGVKPAEHQFIARKADGSIDLGKFLKLKEGYEDLGGLPGDTNPDTEINKKTPEVAVFAANTKYLSDVILPDELKADYEWVYPDTLTAPFAGTKAEMAIRPKNTTGEGDATVIVDFVELTGVKLTLSDDKLIGTDGSLTMTAEPVYAPANLPCDLKDIKEGSISVVFNDKSKLGLTVAPADGTEGLTNAGVVTRGTGAKQGLAKYSATLTLVTTKIAKTTKVTSADVTFETWPAQYEFSFDSIATENVKANLEDIRFAKAGESAELKNLKVSNVADSRGSEKTDVKVTVGDKKVAKVTSSGGTWTVTAVAPGATYLTLTAAADKRATLTIPVIVEGEAYAINASTLTIDRAKTVGAAFRAIGMTGADPNGELVVKAIYKGANKVPSKSTEDANAKKSLKIENTAGNFYTITAIDKDDAGNAIDMLKAGTYTVVLASADDLNLTFDPFNLKVIETKPTVTFKQTKKVNLYYTAGTNSNTGFVTATSKLAKVTLTQNNPDESDFRLVKSGSGYNIVLKDSAGEKIPKGQKINTKIAVTASFDGYKESYSKSAININVSVVTQAPKYVLEIDNKVFYTKLGIDSTELRVYDKTSGTYVNNAEIELANQKDGYKSRFDRANAKFYMIDNTLYLNDSVSNNKGGTAKIRVVHPEFALDKNGNQNEVILNAPISLNTNNPSVTVQKMTLTCQQKGADGLDLAGVEQASATVVVRNAMDYTIREAVLDPKNNAKAKALLPYLDLDWGKNSETGEQMLYVSLKDPDSTDLPALKDALGKGKQVAPGSYTYDATFTLNNQQVTSKVSIKIVDQPTATARVKGSLNILDRSGSKLTVTGNLRNMNGQIVGMRFGNDSTLKKNASQYKAEFAATNLFDIEWQYDNATKQGSAIVTLKDDASYRVNGKYKVTPVFQIATGSGVVEVAAKPITIVTKQSAVKFASAPVLEVKLSKPDVPGTANMAISSPQNLELNEMEQLTMKDNFEVDYDPNSGDIHVSIVDCTGLKANKVYNVVLGVSPVGAGIGTKQQTVTVKVRVIN